MVIRPVSILLLMVTHGRSCNLLRTIPLLPPRSSSIQCGDWWRLISADYHQQKEKEIIWKLKAGGGDRLGPVGCWGSGVFNPRHVALGSERPGCQGELGMVTGHNEIN